MEGHKSHWKPTGSLWDLQSVIRSKLWKFENLLAFGCGHLMKLWLVSFLPYACTQRPVHTHVHLRAHIALLTQHFHQGMTFSPLCAVLKDPIVRRGFTMLSGNRPSTSGGSETPITAKFPVVAGCLFHAQQRKVMEKWVVEICYVSC